jgi:hypothetical protein
LVFSLGGNGRVFSLGVFVPCCECPVLAKCCKGIPLFVEGNLIYGKYLTLAILRLVLVSVAFKTEVTVSIFTQIPFGKVIVLNSAATFD